MHWRDEWLTSPLQVAWSAPQLHAGRKCYLLSSQISRHTSHVTRHTSHVTRHTSHVTRHTSPDGPLPARPTSASGCESRLLPWFSKWFSRKLEDTAATAAADDDDVDRDGVAGRELAASAAAT